MQFCQLDDVPSELDNFYGPELCVSATRKLNFENSPSDNHHQSSSFWDGFGGGRGKQSFGENAPSVAREALASHVVRDTWVNSDP